MSALPSERLRVHAQRRHDLLARLDGSTCVVIAATPVTIRNSDVEHAFRQDSDLWYLTGFAEPETVIVLAPRHKEHRFVMFVRPRDPERETWDGLRAGVEGAKERFGADAAFPIAELESRLPDYLAGHRRLAYAVGRFAGNDARIFAALHTARRRQRLGVLAPSELVEPLALHEQRCIKSPGELEAMRAAVRATAEGHAAAMRVARPGVNEQEVEAELIYAFKKHGASRAAYDSIVGSGRNACILHYRENDRRMEEGDLLLIDAGAEHDFYAADVTRTFPVSGRFTPAQRRLYDAVLAAQLEAIAMVKPGATLEGIHETTVRSLTGAMLELGLLSAVSADEAITKQLYKKFYPHRTSHWLGMDVHDVGRYFVEGPTGEAVPVALAPGQVLTIEPGLYVPAGAGAPPEYEGQGVRIEDDVLVTGTGHDVLTAAIPKDAGELERILAAR
jgi:Xaa-Pro aminopeptidase